MKSDERVQEGAWLKLHLQSCMDREVEVVMFRGEPLYGKLVGFDLTVKPPFIIIDSSSGKLFINLSRVERIRVQVRGMA